ncbi:molybdopterin-guanine dinucleotide biosynthesis protein MobB [Actinokineospora bangkokensis]|uniref:DUF1611 domain-containing protein n=1 Tax=Actinokineospora bangkokensis TaxID=1193682 RepID=A0A1Q9LDU8_9PSEU|nr:molybdopterin-guanine dinucleotide biosynthesis protein MobB [Actinokineospora bangkokensis]OLR90217.1 DUF1611 domain-containing protein [Actinokineospora bangkokensis]
MSAALDPVRADRPKKAYAARALTDDALVALPLPEGHRPEHGDLVLAEVTSVGHHKELELASGRKSRLFTGDTLLVAYAPRYAPDHFEAELPDDFGDCDLVAAGGVLGKVRSRHASTEPPTAVRVLARLGDADGRPLNVADFALPPVAPSTRWVPTFVVVGTSMNSGKTTTVASLVHGLTKAGLRVGATKVTGTAAGGDPWLFRDAGAALALDFTDIGMATTFRMPLPRIAAGLERLHAHLTAADVDAVVVEIADGLLQPETAELLNHPTTRALADGVLFSAVDSSGALFGVRALQAAGHHVLAISGVLTQSPLAIREAQAHVDVPVYGPGDLRSAAIATELLRRVNAPAAHAV